MNFQFTKNELKWIDENTQTINNGTIISQNFSDLNVSSGIKMRLAIAYLNDPKSLELHLSYVGNSIARVPTLSISGKLTSWQEPFEFYSFELNNYVIPCTRKFLLDFLADELRAWDDEPNKYKALVEELFSKAEIRCFNPELYEDN